jgi:hypothetical protein
MRRFRSIALLLAASAVMATPLRAAEDKLLQNTRGTVSYQTPNAKLTPLAINASIGLTDQATTITGTASLATVTMPDSSQVLIGSDSRVQLASFSQTTVANARFVVYVGGVRFAVRHPKGAKANYIFTTPTASVGVRGTEGDVLYAADGSLRVNVYELCDPNAPVEVKTREGKSFTVLAGQSLYAQIVNGIVQTQLGALTQQLIDQVVPDFGVPPSWDAAQGRVVGYAQSATTQAANSVTGGYGGSLIPSLGGLFGHKATPSPAPRLSTCQ